MQADRRLKLAPTLLGILIATGAVTSGAQVTTLRPPVSGLGSGARLGGFNTPSAPASSPAMGALQQTPAVLQRPRLVQTPLSQTPISQAPVLAPRSNVAPQVQPALPQAKLPDTGKVRKAALPQRTQCLPGITSTGLSVGGPTTISLVCNVPAQPTLMDFTYANDQLLQTVKATEKSGFSLWIDYQDLEAAAEGNPKRTMHMVGAQEAYFSHMHVVCLPTGNRNNLTVGPRKGEAYPQITTFCTDGQRVTPVTFAPDENSFGVLRSNVEDGPVAIDYQLVMGGRDPKTGVVRPYPIQTINKQPPFPNLNSWTTNAKNSGDPAIAGIAVLCRSSYVGPGGAAGCSGGLPGPGKQTDATMEYRTYFTDAIARAQNVTVPYNNTKSVLYTLMPGVVPPEFRSATQGACRVALYSAVEVKPIPGGIGVGHPDREPHPKDAYCRKQFGKNYPTAIWAYSPVRNEEMCFSSPEALAAEENAVSAKNAAQYANNKPTAPTPTAVDTCALLPR